MNHRNPFTLRVLGPLLAAALVAGPAFADKPSWAGGGKPGGRDEDRQEARDHGRDRDQGRPEARDHGRGGAAEFRFGDRERRIVSDYYGPQFRAGRCPPGLAKKHNGCMPPGQARKWAMGRPLPADVRYYDLPHDLVVRLPVPPEGQRYVRVASDILLITVGTSMVVDAIQDIGH